MREAVSDSVGRTGSISGDLRRGGRGPICTRFHITFCLGLIASAFSHNVTSARPDAASAPLLTFDSVYARETVTIRNVQWHGIDILIVEVIDAATGKSTVRRISLDGEVVETVGEGELTSVSPDGRLLIFRTGDRWRLHDFESGKGKALPIPDVESDPVSVHYPPVWSRDSRLVAIFERVRSVRSPIVGAGEAAFIEMSGESQTQYDARITIVDPRNPESVERIRLDHPAGRARWSGDGSLLVSQTAFHADSTTIVRIQPGDIGEITPIYTSRGRYQSLLPISNSDGSLLALVLDVDNRTWEDFQSLLLVDPDTGDEIRRLTHNVPLFSGDYLWSPTEDEIIVRTRNGGLDQIYAVPLIGKPRKLTTGLRRHFDMDVSPDGRRLSYQTMDGYGRRDLRVLDLKSAEEVVVKVFDEPAKDFNLGAWRHIRWPSTDGVRPFGYLFTPPDFNSKRQYPAVVDVHGGGPGSRLFLSSSLSGGRPLGPLVWHAWAAAGYVVFVPDYRSTGAYGPRVIADRYDAGEISAIKDIEDVETGVEFLMRQGVIDANRIALYGHSAGGERAYLLLTRTERFAAAVLHEATEPDPVSAFLTLSTGNYTGGYPENVFRHYYGGSLNQVPDRYKSNYMFDSYRNKTPTLIIVGNKALGSVNHLPSEVLYSILRQQGVPTRFLKFCGGGHNYSSPETARAALDEMNEWFFRYLHGNEGG